MNTFPDYMQVFTDNPKRDDSVIRARTSNMQFTAWRLSSNFKKEIPVYIPNLAQADVDTILAFEAANQAIPFYFIWKHDGVTYTVMWQAAVQLIPIPVGRFDVKFTVVEA